MDPVPDHYPVIVIGSGPIGLTLVNLLGTMDVRCLLVERNLTTVQEPRAVSIDDETLRTMQAAGVVDEVLGAVVPGYGSHYYSPSRIRFAKVEPTGQPYGYPRRNAFRAQGVLGAVELLAPQRCTRLVHGALRVGITKKTMVYYGAHAIIDVGHAEGWLDHVVVAQVAELPEARVGIAEGLMIRADASLDYFDWCLTSGRGV